MFSTPVKNNDISYQIYATDTIFLTSSSQLLPVPYFLVTFTVPQSLRMTVRANQRACYSALFDCGARTIVELASGKRFIGTDHASGGTPVLGFFGALHTWGRDFTVYNPHVHFVVPGGGASADGTKWQAAPENFLLPVKAAAKIYPGKFRDAMRAVGIEEQFKQADAVAYLGNWNVDVRPVGNGQAVLKYLAPYVNRVAISDNRIVAIDEQSVTFSYTPSGSHRSKTRTVSGTEFVRGFLQHTLPGKFQRIRYYGWQSPNCRLSFQYISTRPHLIVPNVNVVDFARNPLNPEKSGILANPTTH